MQTPEDPHEIVARIESPEDEARAPGSRLDFVTWTTAISDHYFRNGTGAEAVYLSFDDSVATQIGRAFGGSAQDFEAAVSSVIDPDDVNPFRHADIIWNDHIGVLGILAAQVLAATWMGSFTADAATAYWRPFQRAFTEDRALKNPALNIMDSFWAKTRDHYEALGRGRLSIQPDPRNVPLAGKRHINFPLFQALLREVDRAQIRSWLRDYPEEIRLPAATVLRHLMDSPQSFNKKLAQTLRDAGANKVLGLALETQLSELMAALTGRDDELPRQRAGGRLRLVGLGELECILQRHNGQRWVDAGPPLDDDAIRHGCEDDASGARWRGDDRVLFVDAGNEGYFSHHGVVSSGATVIAMFDGDDRDVIAALAEVRTADEPLSRPVERYVARRFNVSEDDSDLLDLFSCRLATTRALRLEGGLSVRRVWLAACPPRIMLAPGISRVTVNGRIFGADNDGNVTLRPPLSPDHYVVEAGGEQITFDVEDGRSLDDSPDGEEIVYSLAPAMETCHVEKLTASRYLVGAYLGVKPT
jgi:hypothetical protein